MQYLDRKAWRQLIFVANGASQISSDASCYAKIIGKKE